MYKAGPHAERVKCLCCIILQYFNLVISFFRFTQQVSKSVPLFMTLAWLFSVAMIVKGIVYEKEQRLKEVMKVMGLGNGVHWVAWFITSFIVMITSVLLLVTLLKVKISAAKFFKHCLVEKNGSHSLGLLYHLHNSSPWISYPRGGTYHRSKYNEICMNI